MKSEFLDMGKNDTWRKLYIKWWHLDMTSLYGKAII